MHPVGLVLTAQGVDAEQYLDCARQIVPMMGEGDIFGLGGFVATGLFPGTMLPPFKEIVRTVVPHELSLVSSIYHGFTRSTRTHEQRSLSLRAKSEV